MTVLRLERSKTVSLHESWSFPFRISSKEMWQILCDKILNSLKIVYRSSNESSFAEYL